MLGSQRGLITTTVLLQDQNTVVLQDQNAGRLVHGKYKMETSKTKMLRRWVRAPPLPVILLDFEVYCYTYLAEIDSVVSNFQIMKLKH